MSFRRERNKNAVDNDCYEYHIDSNVAFPYGHCGLKLYTKGKVLFEFDTDHCVHYHIVISLWGGLVTLEKL
ncbi:hypothetical protein PAEAM_02490 [Paenibacillus sp. GM1FR]|nr:hypothetical protein PAEAM_02490 [Paenibacillus sp. GM1FR]